MKMDHDGSLEPQTKSPTFFTGEFEKVVADSCAKAGCLNTLFENTPDFVVCYDLECRRINVNPALQAVLGVPLEEILGRTPEELPLLDSQSFMGILRDVIASGQPWRGELAYTNAAGKALWGDLRVVPELDQANNIVAVVGIWRDITERRRLEDRLRQAQKLEVLGRLVGGVAHDFNNVLAAILLHVNLLRTDPRLPSDVLETLQELDADARRATCLPRQLLMFSRQDALQPRPILLEDMVQAILKMLRRIVGERIQIEFLPAARTARIFGDAGLLEQVLLNLCLNARDAMPEGGRITLATSLVEVAVAHARKVSEARSGRFVRFSVADTGCGMDAPTMARVFEPFFTTKPPGRGTGLGLATAADVVRQHQGWMEVKSACGRGSTFFIFLPVHGHCRPAAA